MEEKLGQNRFNVETFIPSNQNAYLPIKMHISSPRSERDIRAHHDFIDPKMFLDFLIEIKGSVKQIDCMIEAKQKDEALFQLMNNLERCPEIKRVDGGSFYVK